MENNKKNEFYVISVEDTQEYGIIKAAIIGRVRWWCSYNETNEVKNRFHDNEWWSGFMNAQEFSEQLGINKRTIEPHITDLVKSGVLIKATFNKKNYDKTGWYRVNPLRKSRSSEYVNSVDPIRKSRSTEYANSVEGVRKSRRPIPVNQPINHITLNQTLNQPVNPGKSEVEVKLEYLNNLIKENKFEKPEDRLYAYKERNKLNRELIKID